MSALGLRGIQDVCSWFLSSLFNSTNKKGWNLNTASWSAFFRHVPRPDPLTQPSKTSLEDLRECTLQCDSCLPSTLHPSCPLAGTLSSNSWTAPCQPSAAPPPVIRSVQRRFVPSVPSGPALGSRALHTSKARKWTAKRLDCDRICHKSASAFTIGAASRSQKFADWLDWQCQVELRGLLLSQGDVGGAFLALCTVCDAYASTHFRRCMLSVVGQPSAATSCATLMDNAQRTTHQTPMMCFVLCHCVQVEKTSGFRWQSPKGPMQATVVRKCAKHAILTSWASGAQTTDGAYDGGRQRQWSIWCMTFVICLWEVASRAKICWGMRKRESLQTTWPMKDCCGGQCVHGTIYSPTAMNYEEYLRDAYWRKTLSLVINYYVGPHSDFYLCLCLVLSGVSLDFLRIVGSVLFSLGTSVLILLLAWTTLEPPYSLRMQEAADTDLED